MQAWLESIAGPGYAAAVMWTLLALLVLVLVLVIIRLVRGLNLGTFVAGGRNRKTRLAVMDATAVDSHRRLILVRRDDIEHLILIGGPTDVVVEQNIRMVPPVRRAGLDDTNHAEQAPEMQAPAPVAAAPTRPAEPRPVPQRPAPAAAPVPAYRPATPAAPQRPVEPRHPPQAAPNASQSPAQPAPAAHSVGSSSGSVTARQPDSSNQVRTLRPVMPSVSATAAPTQPTHAAPSVTAAEPPAASARPAPPPAPTVSFAAPIAAAAMTANAPSPEPAPATTSSQRDLDDALLEELEVSLERESRASTPEPSDTDRALDEEMSKLLSDLSGDKR